MQNFLLGSQRLLRCNTHGDDIRTYIRNSQTLYIAMKPTQVSIIKREMVTLPDGTELVRKGQLDYNIA
jgi:hypothetical protein